MDLQELHTKYLEGANIVQEIKKIQADQFDKRKAIEISYDLQAGSYTDNFTHLENHYQDYVGELSSIISNFSYDSIMEVGVGEASVLSVLSKMNAGFKNRSVLGFDISWSRIKYAEEFYKKYTSGSANFFVGDLFDMPLPESSVDIVYSSHSLEPNGGLEEKALKDLYRVCNKYLILLEPSYEFACEEGKARMNRHGYVKNLAGICRKLGYKVIKHEKYPYCSNDLNPTEVIIVEKNKDAAAKLFKSFNCPNSGVELNKCEGGYFSKNGLYVYPEIMGVPCLRPESGIIATKAGHFCLS